MITYTTILSTIATVISVLAFAHSIWTRYSANKFNKATILQSVKITIDNAKTQLESLSVQLVPINAKKNLTTEEQRQKESYKKIYESAIEKVLNAYEDGCQKYYANLILKEEFKRSYFSDIRKYIEEFPNKFSEPITRYTYMLKLYKEWHKP
jgi:hypothetical protein